MLLTIIDRIESGDFPEGWVQYDDRLVSRFRDSWELVLKRQCNQSYIPDRPGASTSRSKLDGKPANQ